MAETVDLRLEGVPANVATVLSTFISAINVAYSTDLVSVVLYGSAAEDKLTSTSDVNLLVVLRSFSRDQTDRIRDTFLAAQAAINLQAMFLLEDEISSASELFAQKFADILRRHRVILGQDPFSGIKIDRNDKIFRLKQVLLNLALRLRAGYVARSQRPEHSAERAQAAHGDATERARAERERPEVGAGAELRDGRARPRPHDASARRVVEDRPGDARTADPRCGDRRSHRCNPLLGRRHGETTGDNAAGPPDGCPPHRGRSS